MVTLPQHTIQGNCGQTWDQKIIHGIKQKNFYDEEYGEAIWENRSDILRGERLFRSTMPAREWKSPLITAHLPEIRALGLIHLKDRESLSL